VIKEINDSNSDILLIAYSPPKQEQWLYENIQKLNVKMAMGLGGTFDYIAGKQVLPPNFMHQMGLEWLWRLITQPWRIKRIWNAVPVFIWKIYKYKYAKS
jgi:N-acetylglucosaminyldiphosphoundecaprenol N-acetyl-beta-D-mannosaminyltransferase